MLEKIIKPLNEVYQNIKVGVRNKAIPLYLSAETLDILVTKLKIGNDGTGEGGLLWRPLMERYGVNETLVVSGAVFPAVAIALLYSAGMPLKPCERKIREVLGFRLEDGAVMCLAYHHVWAATTWVVNDLPIPDAAKAVFRLATEGLPFCYLGYRLAKVRHHKKELEKQQAKKE